LFPFSSAVFSCSASCGGCGARARRRDCNALPCPGSIDSVELCAFNLCPGTILPSKVATDNTPKTSQCCWPLLSDGFQCVLSGKLLCETEVGTWGVQGVQNVSRSAWVITDASSKTANATSVETHTLAASVFTHAVRVTFIPPRR
jgi:hypothetical protein